MGMPSTKASNALIYVTYGLFLIFGLYIAWRLRNQTKGQFLSGNRTQTAIPLALNFIASAMGSGILFAYPQLATIAGVQGMVVYAAASAGPLLIFAALGPVIRRKAPDGFILTEWTRQRYGLVAALFLSAMSLITMFLYMVAELSALQQTVGALTGMDGLPVIIVQAVVTTIYTSLGGFKVSFITDNIQGVMVVGLIIIATITVGVKTNVDRSLIGPSGLTQGSLLGWQLLYILPVAILTNDFFLSQFWIRTFASKTDKDLKIGVSIASIVVFITLLLVGATGLLAVWSGALDKNDPTEADGSVAFFLLLTSLPAWTIGIVLVMVIALSTAAFDSIQSAMVSTASNDLFRNRLNIWFVRAGVVVLIFPVVVIALKAPSILQIYLITDLVSASVIPVLCVGLNDRFYFWRGFEVVVGGIGGIFTVFLFGTVYYGDAHRGVRLILLEEGLYANDWSAFGAFVASPVGGLLWGIAALVFRLAFQFAVAKIRGRRFDALDKPEYLKRTNEAGNNVYADATEVNEDSREGTVTVDHKGKFF